MSSLAEHELRDVLLVRAFEQADGEGELLSQREREVATRETRAELKRPGEEVAPLEFLKLRSARLRARIERSFPAATRVLEVSTRRRVPLWLVLILSLLLGLGVDRLGNTGAINLLSFPILGLLAWNVIVYLLLFFSDLSTSKAPKSGEGEASRQAAQGNLARIILWSVSPDRFWRGAHASKNAKPEVAVCLQRYLRDWFRVGAPLHLSRGSLRLHLAAAGVMLGAIGGMYLSGLVWHYEASWESTFLTADAVHAVVTFFFTPAAWVLGDPIPGVDVIDGMRAPAGAGPAARWIHYYAVTGGLFVILPRLLLALVSARRASKLSRALPFDLEGDAYFLRMLAVDRGLGQRALVQAYSYQPSARSAEGLTSLLLDVLGGRTRVERLESTPYGEQPAALEEGAGNSAICRVVLFTLSQSPEHEVHGEYLAQLLGQIDRFEGDGSLLIVLDKGPFLERLPRGEEGVARLAERERSWARVLNELELEAVACELDGMADPAALERARQVIHHSPLRKVEA